MRAFVLLAGTATLFQGVQTGCGQYFAGAGLTSIDFCSLLNCTGTSFFNFCNPVPLLTDCPVAAQN